MVAITRYEVGRTCLRALGTSLIAYGILLYAQTLTWQGLVGVLVGAVLYFLKDVWEYATE